MSLWSKYAKPDPKYVKDVGFGARKFKSVNPEYDAERATKEWGPYGEGWGLRNVKYEMLPSTESPTTLILHAEFYYRSQAENGGYGEGCFEISVDTPWAEGRDTFKRIRTMAQSKALSLLGFNSTIFKGQWDDPKYVQEMESLHGNESALVSKVVAAIKSSLTLTQLEACRSRADQIFADGNMSGVAYADITAMLEARNATLSAELHESTTANFKAHLTQHFKLKLNNSKALNAVCQWMIESNYKETLGETVRMEKFIDTFNELKRGGMTPESIIEQAMEDANED
jgi:hypothetical protein